MSSPKHSHRDGVLIIGLDSADWSILRELSDRNLLPNLKRIIRHSFNADLVSTVPDMTPPAWTSFITGVNPARHNVYGFFQPSGNGIKLTGGRTRKAPSIWEMMDEDCVKLLMNVPLTYPASPVNGCMISDSLTFDKSGEWTWPSKEKQNMLRLGYNKCLIPDITQTKKLDQLTESVEARSRAFLDLARRYNSCFSMIVFSETDWVQHLFPGQISAIAEVYKKIDEFIMAISLSQKRQTLLLIASDHGYNLASRKFLINNWLIRIGLLKVRPSRSSLNSLHFPLQAKVTEFAPHLFKLIPRQVSLKIATSIRSPSKSLSTMSGLYSIGWDLGEYLRLHLTENEKERYEYYFTELSEKAKKLIDTKTGQNPIKRVIRKGEVYCGPYLRSAPDFLIQLDRRFSGNERIFPASGMFLDYKAGIHRRNGVIISKWLNTKEENDKTVSKIDVCDIAPTILHVFGRRMRRTDGKVISEIINI